MIEGEVESPLTLVGKGVGDMGEEETERSWY